LRDKIGTLSTGKYASNKIFISCVLNFILHFYMAHIYGSWPIDQPVSTGFRWPEAQTLTRTQDTVTPLSF